MKPSFLILLLPVIASTSYGAANSFRITSGGSHTHVEFISEAPLENIVGKTSVASGSVLLDGDSSRAEIHVDLASIKTGITLRDEHMRNNHLQTDKFPETAFSTTQIDLPNGGLTPDQRTLVPVKGNLLLHGVTREISPETYLTLSSDGQALRIESTFKVKLADYSIPRPQFLMMKLAEEQRIAVDFTAVTDDTAVQLQTGGR